MFILFGLCVFVGRIDLNIIKAFIWLIIGLSVLLVLLSAHVVCVFFADGLAFMSRRFDDVLWWVINNG